MINTRKRIIFIGIVIMLSVCILVVSFDKFSDALNLLKLIGYVSPDFDECKEMFIEEKENIVLITEYLSQIEYQQVYINDYDWWIDDAEGKMSIHDSLPPKYEDIKDEQVVDAIEHIFSNKYSVIDKDDNTIRFALKSKGDFGIGFAYSINQKDEPYIQYLTRLEPLSETGWYYYESDYNEWRKTH